MFKTSTNLSLGSGVRFLSSVVKEYNALNGVDRWTNGSLDLDLTAPCGANNDNGCFKDDIDFLLKLFAWEAQSVSIPIFYNFTWSQYQPLLHPKANPVHHKVDSDNPTKVNQNQSLAR